MSELDEFGIVRYIIDTGDKVVSILLNDIAEDDDTVLLKIKSEYVPVRSDPFNGYLTKSYICEWIDVRGKRYYTDSWKGLEEYIYVVIDDWVNEKGKTLRISTEDRENPYSLDWLLANKEFGGNDGGYLKRNYKIFSTCEFYFYGDLVRFKIDKNTFHDFYGFQKAASRGFSKAYQEAQKKQGS